MKIENFSHPFCTFQNLSFEVEEQFKILIVGPNGIGKTTFLRSLAFDDKFRGLNFYYSGFQDTSSYLSVQEASKILSMEKDFFELKSFSKTPVSRLSSGQLQRFWLNLAFNQKKNLLLDEPTSFLDYKARNVLSDLIKSSSANFMISSHEWEFFFSLVDYVFIFGNEATLHRTRDLNEEKIRKLLP